jgi:glycosyltransferase involved in cell wall biosynthesis
MKTALLHYWLTNMRGGENVLEQFCHTWPEADIFTHAYNPALMPETINNHQVFTSFINKLPGAQKNCQKYLPLMPVALKNFDLSGYELIISSESGPIKGIQKPPGATHICYCHSPMRYLWDMYEDYYHNTSIPGKIAMKLFKNYLRRYDLKSADTVDHFIANSNFVAQRIKRIYNRDSTVIHPPVNSDFFAKATTTKAEYYLVAGQLISYKRPELAIEACLKMNRQLVIVGNGSMRPLLERKYGNKVTFTSRVSNEKLRELYAGAKALIFPGIEDFGIVPLEAQAAGTPVIALRAGGALETVVENKTGLFFDEQNVHSLTAAIEEFEAKQSSFSIPTLKAHATTFSTKCFNKKITSFINQLLPER